MAVRASRGREMGGLRRKKQLGKGVVGLKGVDIRSYCSLQESPMSTASVFPGTAF